MIGGTTRLSMVAALALASAGLQGVGGFSGAVGDRVVAEPTSAQKSQPGDRSGQLPGDTKTNRLRSSWARNSRGGRRAAYGWTNRHAQRVAKKARNVQRHKKTQRRS